MEYYVYQLIDPQSKKVFYVGKGQKNRLYEHVKNVKRQCLPNNNNHLYHKIKKIFDRKLNVKYKKVFITKNEQTAYNKEKELIAEIGLENLCNITDGGEGGGMLGKKHSNETKLKMSLARKGKFLSENIKKKISQSLKGNTCHLGHNHTKETKRKISEAKRGQIPWNIGLATDESIKEKISMANKGKIAWNKGKNLSEEHKNNLSKSHKGHQHSDETKRKISESLKKSKNNGKFKPGHIPWNKGELL